MKAPQFLRFLTVFTLLACLSPGVSAVLETFFLSIKGNKQGQLFNTSTSPLPGQPNNSVIFQSFNLSFSGPAIDSATGAPVGHASIQPISLLRSVDVYSPAVLTALFSTELLPSVVITAVGTNTAGVVKIVLKYTLVNAYLTQVSQMAVSDGDILNEQLTISYKVGEISYTIGGVSTDYKFT